jgi:MFS family permease
VAVLRGEPAGPAARGGSGPRGGRRALAAAVAVTTSTALPVFLTGALAVQLEHSLRFGPAGLGAAVAAYYLAASAGSLPSGFAAERADTALLMQVAAAVSGLTVLVTALLVGSWAALVGVLAAAGVASSMVQPAANALLSRKVAARRQGIAFGVKQSAIPFATLLGGLAVPGLALTVGWRWAFGCAAIACGASVLILSGTRKSPPRHRAVAASRRSPGPKERKGPVLPIVVLTAGFGLGVAAASSLAAFVVASGVAAGMSKGTAGLVATLAGAAAITGRLLAGARADRRGRRHFRAITIMLGAGAAGYAILAAGAAAHVAALLVPAVMLAAGVGWGWNGVFNFALVRSYAQAPAWATGISQTGGRLGSVAGPLTFGIVAERASYGTAWLLCAALACAAALAIITGRQLLIHSRPAAGTAPVPGRAA